MKFPAALGDSHAYVRVKRIVQPLGQVPRQVRGVAGDGEDPVAPVGGCPGQRRDQPPEWTGDILPVEYPQGADLADLDGVAEHNRDFI